MDTWERGWKQWLDEAEPHRDAYYVFGLATRHMPMRAKILDTAVKGGQLQGLSRVWAAAVRSPKDGSFTLLIVNDADRPWLARLAVEGLPKGLSALRCVPDGDPSRTLIYQPVEVRDGTPELRLEPFSLTILTDTPLPADGPGRF